MCGISGFCNLSQNYFSAQDKWSKILNSMSEALKRRGPDDNGIYISNKVCVAHNRLAIIDPENGAQPLYRSVNGNNYILVYNGEVYNADEIRKELCEKGWKFQSSSDSEVVLIAFIEYGIDCVKKFNGIFAFAVWDESREQMFLVRDRLGIKPLFYTIKDDTLVFGSELKVLFKYPGITPKIDKNGLNEIFALGPAKTYGCGVFKDIHEVLPANFCLFDNNGFKQCEYWHLESKPHEDTYEQTVEKVSYLVKDAIKGQMVSDVPICTLLSGGLDSSIVSSVCSSELGKLAKQLTTFSFDFVDNDKYYKSNSFQPSQDRPYVDIMLDYIKSNHIYLECDMTELADALYTAVDAKDLPGMADVDSSLLYFCSKVAKYCKVTLTGECADEYELTCCNL